MTKEALKLALEALENHSGNYKLSKAECVKYQAVEAAIKEALAQDALGKKAENARELGLDYEPEQGEPVAHPFEDKAVISSLSWAAGLIEQAYRECGGHNGADSWLMNYADKQGERIRQADHREWEKVNGRWKVKATPPQRTWVGLTDEELSEFDVDPIEARLMIAKLRSKNT